jgi:hypothetical protein
MLRVLGTVPQGICVPRLEPPYAPGSHGADDSGQPEERSVPPDLAHAEQEEHGASARMRSLSISAWRRALEAQGIIIVDSTPG